MPEPTKADAELSSLTVAERPPGEGEPAAGAGAEAGGATVMSLRLSVASRGQAAGKCLSSSRWKLHRCRDPKASVSNAS